MICFRIIATQQLRYPKTIIWRVLRVTDLRSFKTSSVNHLRRVVNVLWIRSSSQDVRKCVNCLTIILRSSVNRAPGVHGHTANVLSKEAWILASIQASLVLRYQQTTQAGRIVTPMILIDTTAGTTPRINRRQQLWERSASQNRTADLSRGIRRVVEAQIWAVYTHYMKQHSQLTSCTSLWAFTKKNSPWSGASLIFLNHCRRLLPSFLQYV